MRRPITAPLRLVASAMVLAGVASVGADAQSTGPIPDLAVNGEAWQMEPGLEFNPVPGAPKPVSTDPAYPYITNTIARRTGQQPNYHIPDLTNPNLKQWAKDFMRKDTDEILAGKLAYKPSQSCEPWGIPALLQAQGPYFIVQSPKVILMMQEMDRFARHIYLNVPHSKNPKPSWYGESVGHYEGGTLVVDTIGFNTKTYVDFFRTPHTEKLHVIERWTLIDGGKQLEVHITVEDPDTFYQPWQGTIRMRRTIPSDDTPELGENICSEGNFNLFDYKVPIADKPDF